MRVEFYCAKRRDRAEDDREQVVVGKIWGIIQIEFLHAFGFYFYFLLWKKRDRGLSESRFAARGYNRQSNRNFFRIKRNGTGPERMKSEALMLGETNEWIYRSSRRNGTNRKEEGDLVRWRDTIRVKLVGNKVRGFYAMGYLRGLEKGFSFLFLAPLTIVIIIIAMVRKECQHDPRALM